MFDNIEPWTRFAYEVSRELASPDAEDLSGMVRESDLPALVECLRGTLARDSATIAALRSECYTLRAELAALRELVGEVPRALVAGLPEVVSRLVEEAEGQTLPGGGGR